MNSRGSGLLLHITSLPSRFGIGDLGPAAFEFIKFLSDAGQRYWQILPIHPTDPAYDNSPYHSLSAFAFNPLFISPEVMVLDGFLDESDLDFNIVFPGERVDFSSVIAYKEKLLSIACHRFIYSGEDTGFSDFCNNNEFWLEDYSLFAYLRRKMRPYAMPDWPEDIRSRKEEIIRKIKDDNWQEIRREKIIQYMFKLQWDRLHEECKRHGISVIGDIPIYVDSDSADVWLFPDFFKLDHNLKPLVISGVPPDFFSNTGQLWNTPVYNWEELKKADYSWWINRVKHLVGYVDYLRVDHFRGLVGYWEVPAGAVTAADGKWEEAPGWDFLKNLFKRFRCMPIIAEDLGIITPDVREVMREFSIPGMKVLQFAFTDGMADNPYLPHNIKRNCIVYTGTHDNNPIMAWFESDTSEKERKFISEYLGRDLNVNNINSELIRIAMMSVADISIIPVQDLLNLGSGSRMNKPGTDLGNWTWRVKPDQLTREISENLMSQTRIYGRI